LILNFGAGVDDTIGSLMCDIEGKTLSNEDLEILSHPLVGGVILFDRNYDDPDQLTALTNSIREASKNPLLIGVDHEGGRVQRFREGFTAIPPMQELGETFDKEPGKAKQFALGFGAIIAAELRQCGVDLNFSPVLDLQYDRNTVIGDRAFHHDPEIVTELAAAFIRGLRAAGMHPVGKHFPGHGFVSLDSHLAHPVDDRTFKEISENDLVPFQKLIEMKSLSALMPAHIVYSEVDEKPACYSKKWLKTILCEQLNFDGVIFSDDLNMKGAEIKGGYANRIAEALKAGCNMVLLCNNRKAVKEVLQDKAWQKISYHPEKLYQLMSRDVSEKRVDPVMTDNIIE
jgi:beta-N-acetylhexosaminidase